MMFQIKLNMFILHCYTSAQQIMKYEKISPTSEFKSQLRLIKEKSEEMGLTTSRNNNKANTYLTNCQLWISTAANIPCNDACFRNPIYRKNFMIQRQNGCSKRVFKKYLRSFTSK